MFWKIYFFLLVLLLGISYAGVIGELTLLLYADFLVSVLSLVGLYGLAFSKKYFSAKFWQIYFYVYLIWDFMVNPWLTQSIEGSQLNPVDLLFSLAVLAPLLFALHLYGFRFLKGVNHGRS